MAMSRRKEPALNGVSSPSAACAPAHSCQAQYQLSSETTVAMSLGGSPSPTMAVAFCAAASFHDMAQG